MSDADTPPEPDRADGAPHPRNAPALIGQDAASAAFLAAQGTRRLHHAWLITGPPGVGKATLAWRIARYLLAPTAADEGPGLFGAADNAPVDLSTDPDSPRNRRITALSDPGLFLLRRGWDDKARPPRLRQVITVDEVRRMRGFFSMSVPDGGRRVVIVDDADSLNVQAANALLKLLEEPPANTVFLLVSHMPSRLLPTIRSRCRTLPCAPLSPDDVAAALAGLAPDLGEDDRHALARLSGGSVGAALRLHVQDGLALAGALDRMLGSLPGLDRMAAQALAGDLAARGAEDRRALFLDLLDARLAGLARQGATGQASAPPVPPQLAPSPAAGRRWAEAQGTLTGRVRQGLAVNLDPHALILDMVLTLETVAADCAAEGQNTRPA
ncbi:DNA polymerase III subunit delta' [Meridianimarinicoccus sp. RP-17]